MPDGAIVYNGMTAQQLAAGFNVASTVPDLPAYQAWGAEQSKRVSASMPHERNVPYGEADIQKLDIFAPAGNKNANAPVLVDIHGGGWTAGSKNGRSFTAEAIVPKGVVWAPIDYGLAPAYKLDKIVQGDLEELIGALRTHHQAELLQHQIEGTDSTSTSRSLLDARDA